MKTPATETGPRPRPGRYSGGQGTVEFAFAGVMFLFLIFTIMEMALAVLAYNSICYAASEAARYGSALPPSGTTGVTVTQNSAGGTSAVEGVAEAAAASITLTASNFTVTWPSDSLFSGGTDVSVRITYNFALSIPGMTAVTLPLTATAQMLCSQQTTTS